MSAEVEGARETAPDTHQRPGKRGRLYASGLAHEVRAEAVRPIFESMVDVSDHGQLMQRFLALPFPRMFMYGEQNRALSYLPTLVEGGVEVAEIPHSGHGPMYSNAPEVWKRIADFVTRTSVGHAVGHAENAAGAGIGGQEGQDHRACPRAWRWTPWSPFSAPATPHVPPRATRWRGGVPPGSRRRCLTTIEVRSRPFADVRRRSV